jgi:hypothetical protein
MFIDHLSLLIVKKAYKSKQMKFLYSLVIMIISKANIYTLYIYILYIYIC